MCLCSQICSSLFISRICLHVSDGPLVIFFFIVWQSILRNVQVWQSILRNVQIDSLLNVGNIVCFCVMVTSQAYGMHNIQYKYLIRLQYIYLFFSKYVFLLEIYQIHCINLNSIKLNFHYMVFKFNDFWRVSIMHVLEWKAMADKGG